MRTFSYVIVLESGERVPGTDATGNFDSADELGRWWCDKVPDAVEVEVWAGEFTDRPRILEAVA